MELIAQNFSFEALVLVLLLCSHIQIINVFPDQFKIKGEVG
jgi:hypothetical protein